MFWDEIDQRNAWVGTKMNKISPVLGSSENNRRAEEEN